MRRLDFRLTDPPQAYSVGPRCGPHGRRCCSACGCGPRSGSRSTSRSGSARQSLLGRHLGGDRLPAAARRVAAQGLVPHDRHARRRGDDRRADRLLSAGSLPVSARPGIVGRGVRVRRHAAAQLRVLRGGAGRLYGGDHRQRPARRDRRRERRAPSCSPSPGPAKSASASSAPASFSPGPTSVARGAGWPRCSPSLSAEITERLHRHVGDGRAGTFADTQPVRREFVRRVIALDPIIDQALGESLPAPLSLAGIAGERWTGLFAALAGWHAVADHLAPVPETQARQRGRHRLCKMFRRNCERLRRGTASRRAGWPTRSISTGSARPRHGGLTLCRPTRRRCACSPIRRPRRSPALARSAQRAGFARRRSCATAPGRGAVRLRVPDWLPALVNAGRAPSSRSARVALFWIVTGWPGGALASPSPQSSSSCSRRAPTRPMPPP